MRRRQFLSAWAAVALAGGPAFAQDHLADVIDQLKAQGFRSIVQERTWLGRVRILATRKGGRREIILNPGTGEILRDLWLPANGNVRELKIIDSGKLDDEDDDEDDRGHGSGDDDDDDDDRDDDDGGDRSGSGHGGGGSGDDDD